MVHFILLVSFFIVSKVVPQGKCNNVNIITLIATLYHTATYFVMTPKVMNIIVKNERLPHHLLRNALWAVTAVISVIALILVYM